MPELPEVENLVVELSERLGNRKISGAEVRNPSILETPREWLEKEIRGKEIVRVGRRGKFIEMRLSGNFILWFHLGMTGQLLLKESVSNPPHTHFILSFAGSEERLIYRDVRRFGRIALTPAAEEALPEGVKRLGPEPWDWDEKGFISLMKGRRARIKSLLLNQTIVAGLGNIYADESLHRAGIHPMKRAGQVPRARLSRLHQAMREVLEEAIRFGGSSIDDYLHLDGGKGQFQEFHQVYGRTGERCDTCGTLIRTARLSGRSSSYCPRCQR